MKPELELGITAIPAGTKCFKKGCMEPVVMLCRLMKPNNRDGVESWLCNKHAEEWLEMMK